MISTLVICGVILVLSYRMFMKYRQKGILPPGPKGIPVFGNALQFDARQFALQLSDVGNQFDDAYTVRFFSQNFVVMNSYDMIMEVMTSSKYAQIFSGRPKTFVGEYVAQEGEIFPSYSEEWAARRKIVFRGLKTYGANLVEVEELVQKELRHLMSRIQTDAGKSVDPYDYVCCYVISILSMLLTAQHIKHDDPLIQLFIQITNASDNLLHPETSALIETFPWLRHLPFGAGKVYQALQQYLVVLETAVLKGFEDGENRKPCFLSYMLEEKTKGHLTDENIKHIVYDNLIGATGTSRSSLNSLFLILASKPDVQRKIQEEIDREIGKSRLPCAEDKNRLSYCQAVLWELLRLYSPVPFPIPRCTMEDVEIGKYYLPKDTVVFYNVWKTNHDDKFWQDPWAFNPSRFLDDTGDLIPPEDEKRKRMISFGVGKRLCVGEVVARLRIFMVMVAILQWFTILPDPDKPLPDTDPRTFEVSVLLTPPRYNVIFQPRSNES